MTRLRYSHSKFSRDDSCLLLFFDDLIKLQHSLLYLRVEAEERTHSEEEITGKPAFWLEFVAFYLSDTTNWDAA